MQRKLLSRLPLRESSSFIDICLRLGDLTDAKNWHTTIQPDVINAKRPDAKWNWPNMLTRIGPLERRLGRDVSLYCLEGPNQSGQAVPLAMMLLCEGYPALDGGATDSVFLWFLAATPEATLKKLGVTYRRPALLVEALVDTAIQRSYELGYDGRVGLHAAPEGGDPLYCRYRDGARMVALRGAAEISWARRLLGKNDKRYFWSDPKLSQSLSNSLDYLR